MIKETKELFGLKYIIRYPENYDEKLKYPVLLFMHGAGTRGEDISLLYNNPFFKITDKYKSFPFITVAPQCTKDSWFDLFESVIDLAKHIYNMEFTDKDRFYAIGASMGGYAVWQLSMSCPELFAAVVPICGGGMYWNAERLKSIPVWAFHGDSDPTVRVEESVKMTDAVNRHGGTARLTVYKDCGHDAWSETYSNYDVFLWLLGHTKKNANLKINNEFKNSKIYG